MSHPPISQQNQTIMLTLLNQTVPHEGLYSMILKKKFVLPCVILKIKWISIMLGKSCENPVWKITYVKYRHADT